MSICSYEEHLFSGSCHIMEVLSYIELLADAKVYWHVTSRQKKSDWTVQYWYDKAAPISSVVERSHQNRLQKPPRSGYDIIDKGGPAPSIRVKWPPHPT